MEKTTLGYYLHLATALKEYGEKIISIYRQKLAQKNIDATGTLGNTISCQVTVNSEVYEVNFKLQDYWKYVEEGRTPGKFPPPDKIREWIEIKPILPNIYNGKLPTIEQLTYLISRKIAVEGIEGKHPLQEATEELQIEEAIKNAITKDIEISVSKIIKL